MENNSKYSSRDQKERPAKEILNTDNPACERCGKPDALKWEGHSLCNECTYAFESCCLEFGGDDLWEEER